MTKYIASVSFGKDSLAMLLKIIEHKLPLDEVVYCEPWFDDELSAEFPEMVDFIKEAERLLEKKFGIKVKHIKSEFTFKQVFYQKKKKGKFVGTIYGFPMTLKAWCNDRLKVRALDEYFKQQGEHVRYIGYACDEPNRIKRLEKNEIAPLVDLQITETEAYEICKREGLLAPLYKDFQRIGCWFCPKQSLKSLKVVYEKYPDLWEVLKELQNDSPVPFKPNKTIFDLDKKFSEVSNDNL